MVLLRTGIVLEKSGGALQKMLPPFACGLGGPLGSGRQWFPWIHLQDEVGIILWALENQKLSGPVNAVAPEPVTMQQFSSSLGRVLQRPSWLPVPAFALKILLGEMSSMLLEGERVSAQKILEAGYRFKHPKLDEALVAILKNSKGNI